MELTVRVLIFPLRAVNESAVPVNVVIEEVLMADVLRELIEAVRVSSESVTAALAMIELKDPSCAIR